MELGAEGGVARENVGLQKLAVILILYSAIVLKSMSKLV